MPLGPLLPLLFWLLTAISLVVAWGCGVGIPEAPSHLSVEAPSEADSLPVAAVAWKDNAVNEEYHVVERASSPDGPWQVVVVEPSQGGEGRFVVAFDQTLSSGGSYWYRAYACNGSGRSPYSNVVIIQVALAPGFTPLATPPIQRPC